MDEPAHQPEGSKDNLLLRRYVLERKEADYAQLYTILFPQLVRFLQSQVYPQPQQFYEDVVSEKLNELGVNPDKFWPQKDQPPRAFAIFSKSVYRLALDKLEARGVKQTIVVEPKVLEEIAENHA